MAIGYDVWMEPPSPEAVPLAGAGWLTVKEDCLLDDLL